MKSVMGSAEARANFSDILAQAYYQGKFFVITKSKKPCAIVMGIKEFERIEELLAEKQGSGDIIKEKEKEEKAPRKKIQNKILSVSY